jgi:hypothetical protein
MIFSLLLLRYRGNRICQIARAILDRNGVKYTELYLGEDVIAKAEGAHLCRLLVNGMRGEEGGREERDEVRADLEEERKERREMRGQRTRRERDKEGTTSEREKDNGKGRRVREGRTGKAGHVKKCEV